MLEHKACVLVSSVTRLLGVFKDDRADRGLSRGSGTSPSCDSSRFWGIGVRELAEVTLSQSLQGERWKGARVHVRGWPGGTCRGLRGFHSGNGEVGLQTGPTLALLTLVPHCPLLVTGGREVWTGWLGVDCLHCRQLGGIFVLMHRAITQVAGG